MTVRTKARLIFSGMFLATFGCGALAGRLGVQMGLPTLVYRNALAIFGSYVGFLLMMFCYIRAVRSDPVFLREAAVESAPSYEKKSLGDGGGFLGDLGLDFEVWVVLLAVLILILLVVLWIGVEGPALLLDEASAAAIAAGLAGKTTFLLEPSWLRRVVTRTIIPVAIYLICSSIVMAYADVHCPGRLKFSQVVKECVIGSGGK